MCRERGENGRNRTDEKTPHPFYLTAALVGGFFMAACAAPAPKTDAVPAPKPFLADASVCRDQFGQPAPRYEWSMWFLDMQRANPDGVESRTMTGAERMRFLGAYNSTPPISDVNPERIEMFWIDPLVVAVVFVEDGCVTYAARMMRQLLESVISPNTNGRQSEPPIMQREA